MTSAPAFRQIGTPLDVADADLDQLNRRLGVPTLVTAAISKPMAPPIPIAPVKAINLHLPEYVIKALKDKARLADSSVRYIVMMALVEDGITIHAVDLVPDARRSSQSSGA